MKVCKKEGIHCPILPGIMPVQGYSSFQKMTQFCRTRVLTRSGPIWLDFGRMMRVKYGVNCALKFANIARSRGVVPFLHLKSREEWINFRRHIS